MRARLGTAVFAVFLTAILGTPGAEAASGHQTLGGPLLAGKGVIVEPLPGAPALPPASQLPASSWMVTNLTTGQVLAAKDPHGKFLPASTLKTLTALTLLPRLDAHSTFTATEKDASVDGTRVGLVPGMSYTVAKLFACMLVVSANDAADALAQDNGGISKTVAEMNAEAHELQANDTHADTPSGLDGPGETTSAYDLALIAKQDMTNPTYLHYVQILHTTVPAPHHKHFAIYTHNELLDVYHYRGAIGGKNGYTVAADGTDVNAATRHGQTILVTLMHAYPNFWPMAADLLNWGFKANGKVTPIGNLVAPLPPPVIHANLAINAAKPLPVAFDRKHHGLPWLPIEIAGAAVIVLAAGQVRRRRSRRSYQPRLRLPPY